jgi:hypothetical protein
MGNELKNVNCLTAEVVKSAIFKCFESIDADHPISLKCWNLLTSGERETYKKITLLALLTLLKQSPYGFFRGRASFYEAQYDLEVGKKTALRIKDRGQKNYALLDIVIFETVHDLKEAKQIALLIDSPEIQAIALRHIVTVEAQQDLAAAKQTAQIVPEIESQMAAFLTIVAAEVQHDLEAAKQTAQRQISLRGMAFTDLEGEEYHTKKYRDRALLQIAQFEARQDPSAAKQTAMAIADKGIQSNAFLKIATIEAKQDLSAAKQTAIAIADQQVQREAFLKIAKIEAQQGVDVSKALQTIKDEVDTNDHKILGKVAQIEALYDLQTAVQTVQTIASAHRYWPIRNLIGLKAKQDLKAVKLEAQVIQDNPVRASLLMKIAEIEIKQDVEAAKQTIQTIKEIIFSDAEDFPAEERDSLVSTIVSLEMNFDLEAAKRDAQIINDEYLIYDIIEFETLFSPDEARRTFYNLLPPSSELRKIRGIKIEAHRDFIAVTQSALSMRSCEEKWSALLDIVESASHFLVST